MAKCDKLLEKAHNNPKGLRFTELVQLAECYGFTFARQKGSHRSYKRAGFPKLLNLQPEQGGMAKKYQVLELLGYIEELSEE
ncbi:MAG TPA: type II toxin-antitoxin system HicA family toxin [Ardenticatenaceae bacterium]|jgi:hypothetical protein